MYCINLNPLTIRCLFSSGKYICFGISDEFLVVFFVFPGVLRVPGGLRDTVCVILSIISLLIKSTVCSAIT